MNVENDGRTKPEVPSPSTETEGPVPSEDAASAPSSPTERKRLGWLGTLMTDFVFPELRLHETKVGLVFVALIVAVTIVAFWPTFQNDFVNWDDDVNLVNNARYRGLWPNHIRWMFSTTHQGPYQPLSWMSYAVDYLIWGLDPEGYHLTSLLLHTAGAVVFYLVALRLLRQAFGIGQDGGGVGLSIAATAAALVFAVHPLRVESVAWATERRDVLSGLFLFMATLAYLRARGPRAEHDQGPGRSLGWTFVFFVAALLSKGTTLVLPIVLLILDVYPLRRLSGDVRSWFTRANREVWIEKVPFFIASLLVGIMAIRGQMQAGALLSLAERDIPARIATAFYGPAFYLWKTLVPLNLSPLYEWPVKFSPVTWPFLLSGVLVIVLTVLFVRFRQAWPAGLSLWGIYLVFLVPVLLPLQSGVHLAADRYTYLSCAVWALLVGAGIAYGWRRRGPGMAVTVLAGVGVVALAGLTFRQTSVWRDTWTLWDHAHQLDDECWHAYGGLARELHRRQEYDRAIEMYNKALAIAPDSAELRNNLGSVYTSLQQHGEALGCYRDAVRLSPELAAAHYNLAGSLIHLGRLDEAVESLQEAIRLNSRFARAYHRLGDVLVRLAEAKRGKPAEVRKQYEQAMQCYLKAYKLNPDDRRPFDAARQVTNKLEALP